MNRLEEVVSARGLLAEFNTAGVLLAPDVHVAQVLGRLYGEPDEQVLLAVALCVRALRLGSVCLDLGGLRERVVAEMLDPALDIAADDAMDVDALDWPEPAGWLARLRTSTMVGQGADLPVNEHPVRLVDDLLYLERYWAEEGVVRRRLDERAAHPVPAVDPAVLEGVLATLFDGEGLDPGEVDRQREAAEHAAGNWTTVVAGGPGTGKTTTVARLLAALQAASDHPLRIALAAPSGKAAARLQQAVTEAVVGLPGGLELPRISQAATLHKLLDARGPGRGFGRGEANPLPHEVVVVDEMSMVALPLMARLLESVRDDTRLVLVGDPNQLTSVDAGAVLADLVNADADRDDVASTESPDPSGTAAGPVTAVASPSRDTTGSNRAGTTGTGRQEGAARPRTSVTVLTHTWRFGREIAQLAEAIRGGDADRALQLLDRGTDVHLTRADAGALQLDDLPPVRQRVLEAGGRVHAAAVAGLDDQALEALDSHRLLCAHREGRWGVSRWGRMVEDLLRREVPGYGQEGEWYLGRPLLVTQNLRDLQLSNGDSGVVVAHGSSSRAVIGTPGQSRSFSPYLLDAITSLHAMTVHKAQGSQFREVSVVLPPPESSLLTRELLYTAVTRASRGVRLIGAPEAVRKAVLTPAVRASGLARGW